MAKFKNNRLIIALCVDRGAGVVAWCKKISHGIIPFPSSGMEKKHVDLDCRFAHFPPSRMMAKILQHISMAMIGSIQK